MNREELDSRFPLGLTYIDIWGENENGIISVWVEGKTYDVREMLKARKFRWDPVHKVWRKDYSWLQRDEVRKDVTELFELGSYFKTPCHYLEPFGLRDLCEHALEYRRKLIQKIMRREIKK